MPQTIQNNSSISAWLRECLNTSAQDVVVCEDTLGSGENFGVCCVAWLERKQASSTTGKLHYVSTLPLGTRLEDLAESVRQYIPTWPLPIAGVHRVTCCGGAVQLTLLLRAEQQTTLQALRTLVVQADVLICRIPEGAAQTNNPQYTLKALATLARLGALMWVQCSSASDSDATQRAVQQAGFQRLTESPGGYFTVRYVPTWSSRDAQKPLARPRSAMIIGAGLAGCSIAHALALEGVRVTVLERQVAPARETTNHVAALLHPDLARDDNPLTRLTRHGFFAAQQQWDVLQAQTPENLFCRGGILEKPSADVASTFAQLNLPSDYVQAVDAVTAAQLSGLSIHDVPQGGWWWPQGAWASPPALCRAALAHANIVTQFGVEVAYVRASDQSDSSTRWQALDGKGTVLAESDVVVVANALAAPHVLQASHLMDAADIPLQAVRGQLNYLTVPLPVSTWPQCAVCGDGYVLPPWQGIAQYGASYALQADEETFELRPTDSLENLEKLQRLIPSLRWHDAPTLAHGWAANRCVTPDRLPMIGACLDSGQIQIQNHDWASHSVQSLPRVTGVYIATGYASRGLTWAALGATILTSAILGNPAPLTRDLLDSLDPARFALRALRRTASN